LSAVAKAGRVCFPHLIRRRYAQDGYKFLAFGLKHEDADELPVCGFIAYISICGLSDFEQPGCFRFLASNFKLRNFA
jgi:hypothetical protein